MFLMVKTECFPCKMRNKARMLTLTTYGGFSQCKKFRKVNKLPGKISVYIFYVENCMNSTEMLPELVSLTNIVDTNIFVLFVMSNSLHFYLLIFIFTK